MKNKFVKYICILFSTFFIMCSVLSAFAYMYDPQNVYRWNETGMRYFSPKYSTASSIKTYDYNLAVIGSSMVQNFDAQTIAEELACKPLKLTIGAITPDEMLWLYKCANEQNKADTYIINIDLHRFTTNNIEISPGRFTEYTYDIKGISQFKYLLGYETWFRFIPLDIAMTIVDNLGINLPETIDKLISDSTDINKMCEFDNTNLLDKEKMYQNFTKNIKTFNEDNTFENLGNGCKNIQFFLNELDKYLSETEKLVLILPPYSVLYWAKMTNEQLNTLFEMRELIASFAQTRENIILMDFQSEDYTTDLNKYMDTNHFGPEIEEQFLYDIIKFKKNCTFAEISENSEKIRKNLEYTKAQAALIQ